MLFCCKFPSLYSTPEILSLFSHIPDFETLSKIKSNWHTHTRLCRHATGNVADYCRSALENGVEVLGFADHMPTPDGRWSSVRMDLGKLSGYAKEIEKAKRKFPALKIYAGLECEWYPPFGREFYTETLLGSYRLDYLAGAPHSFPGKDGKWHEPWTRNPFADQEEYTLDYGRHVVSIIETGIFAFIAHPDLFGCFRDSWSGACEKISFDIAEASAKCNVPLEFNTSGFRKGFIADSDGSKRRQYPLMPFWKIVSRSSAPVILNSDAHEPENVAFCNGEALRFLEEASINPINFTSVSPDGKLLPK